MSEEDCILRVLMEIRDELRRRTERPVSMAPKLMKLADAAAVLGISKTQVELLYSEGKVTRFSSNGRPGGNRLVDPQELVRVLRVEEAPDGEGALVERLLSELSGQS